MSRLKREDSLACVQTLSCSLAKEVTADKVAQNASLRTLRIILNDVEKRLAKSTSTDANANNQSAAAILASNADQPHKIEEKIRQKFASVSVRDQILSICKALSTEKNERLCGFLADLFVELNVDMVKMAPEEELELFFKSAARLPQLQFRVRNPWQALFEMIQHRSTF